MNSFDVFDTLVARRYVKADPIWARMEAELKMPGFARARVAVDDGRSTIAEMYARLGLGHEAMEREIALECEYLVPIQANIDRVADGDLLISDMYLRHEDILRLVRHAGLAKQVTLYRSNGGKASGEIWRRLQGNKPALHLGDNAHSDYAVPKSLGFACELYRDHGLTSIETSLVNAGLPNMACLVREVRLRHAPMAHLGVFEVANQVNLPWLLVTAEMLRRRHGARPLVFLGRDCQLLSRVYDAYVAPCLYKPFSRHVAFRQPEAAGAFLADGVPAEALLVDISSTGATWQHLGAALPIEAVIYSDLFHYTAEKPVPPQTFSFVTRNSVCGQTNILLEVFNCGDHGHLRGIDRDGDLLRLDFAPVDMEAALIAQIHAPVACAVSLAGSYRAPMAVELGTLTDEALFGLFKDLIQTVCAQNQIAEQVGALFQLEQRYMHGVQQMVA